MDTSLTVQDSWYLVWRDQAGRNVSETARILGIPRTTIQRALERGRWRERVRVDDTHVIQDATSLERVAAAALLPDATATIAAAIRTRLDPRGKPPPDAPSANATKSAFNLYAIFGIAPVRQAQLDITTTTTSRRLTDDELDALSLDQLIAVAMGKPVPELPLPQDFTSTQPGGREVSDPHPDDDQVVEGYYRTVLEEER